MSGSVPCWTAPITRRHFGGEHADSPEELEIDSLRHQLREAQAELAAPRRVVEELAERNGLALRARGGP